MKKIFNIELKVNIPEELENKYIGDEQTKKDIKEVLLDEIPEETKPEITINVQDSESILITKEEYEQLKEKAWQYDQLCK